MPRDLGPKQILSEFNEDYLINLVLHGVRGSR